MDDFDPVKDLENGFDVVVMGTGLTETILSGILSVEGKRVLHLDQNTYYGADGASLKISQVFEKFRGKGAETPAALGKDRDWNIDLIPKFLMSNGELARILRSLRAVQDNVQFQLIDGSYVFRSQGGGLLGLGGATISKVPSTAMEAATSSLVGTFEKGRLKSFLEYVAAYDPTKGSLHSGTNLDTETMKAVYDKFKLEDATRDFVGHAMALYSDNSYLDQPARVTFDKVRLYASSVAAYGSSPYIYPLYGLGELPSAFTRLSAVHGGTYMLNTKVIDFENGPDGKVASVKIKFENPKKDNDFLELSVPTKSVVAAPDYVSEGTKKKKTGQRVIRAICVLKHSVKSLGDSGQIILPQSQIGRKNDIYIAVLSTKHQVCPKGFWLAIVSTIAERDANHHEELKPAFDLLGEIEETFMGAPSDLWGPADNAADNVFVSKSLDASSHLETCTDDVKSLYKAMEGKELDIEKFKPVEE